MATQWQKIKHQTDQNILSIQRSRSTLRSQRRHEGQIQSPKTVIRRDLEKAPDVYLVVRRKPLDDLPWLWRWMIRAVYFQTGWASDYSVEYQGVFAEESAARHAASGPGMSYTRLPLNGSLPEETCDGGVHDFPLSEVSYQYRNRRLKNVAVARAKLERDIESVRTLEYKVECLQHSMNGADK